jgi:hypothetical protein
MRTFTKVLAGSAAAVALAAFAPAASAAIFVNNWTIAANGEITVTFGDDALGGADATGTAGDHGTAFTHSYDNGTSAFTDTFDFFLPTGVVANAAISTSTLVFDSIVFNGIVGNVSNAPGLHVANVGNVQVTEGGEQHLVISGSGLPTAGWSGTASFVPVPEPTTWGLMIMGFGGIGALVRGRRRQAALA